jgi:predicted Fe-Mo cluster-binding NifX family protein
MEKKRNAHSILVGMSARTILFQKLGTHGRLTLKWILKIYKVHPGRKDRSAIKKYKQNKTTIITNPKILFSTFATTIQAFVIACDEFLYGFVIDLYHQSI